MITNYEDKIEGMYDKNSEDFGAQRWGCGMQRAMMRRNDGVAAWGCGMQRATMRLWCAMMGSWYARGVKRWGRKSNNCEVIANFTAKELSSGFVFSMP